MNNFDCLWSTRSWQVKLFSVYYEWLLYYKSVASDEQHFHVLYKSSNVFHPFWDTTKKLTVNQAVAGLHVANDANRGDGEHAAQAEDVAAQAVVDAGEISPQPGVVEGGHDGEWVEADAAQEVHHGQVDAQQLGAHHLLPPAVADDQDQPVAQNRK